VVIGGLLRAALATATQYRASFLVDFLAGLGGALAVALPVGFVYAHTPVVAGWTRPEALLVTGFFLVLQGLVGALVEPNFGALVEAIRKGTFDFVLLKPADAQLVASFQRVAPARAWDLLAGLGVGGWALSQLPAPSWGQVAAALAMLLAGLAAVYGLYLLVVCTSFWFVRVDNLRHLLGAILDAGRWPVGVYRGAARVFLTMIVPVALVTSGPAMALTGRLDGSFAARALVVGAASLLVSRIAWNFALSRHASAGG
jgi:ABC-2 type transport system permease protein